MIALQKLKVLSKPRQHRRFTLDHFRRKGLHYCVAVVLRQMPAVDDDRILAWVAARLLQLTILNETKYVPVLPILYRLVRD